MIKILLGSFFAASSGAIAKRVLLSLGMGIISTAGVTLAINNMIDLAHAQYNTMTGYMLALCGLAGVGYGLGLLVGAIVFRVAMSTTSKIGVIPS